MLPQQVAVEWRNYENFNTYRGHIGHRLPTFHFDLWPLDETTGKFRREQYQFPRNAWYR